MLQQLSQGVGVQLLQELSEPPTVLTHSLFGSHSVKNFHNIPKNQNANGTASGMPFITPKAGCVPQQETLPRLPPILLVTVYVPADKRLEVEALLSWILKSHPNFFLGGNFNAASCPYLDLSLTDDPCWHW